MKKNVLFVLDQLTVGGIENTLLSWLNYISIKGNYNTTLVLLNSEGELLNDIPKNVTKKIIKNKNSRLLLPLRKELLKSLKNMDIGFISKIVILYIKFLCNLKKEKITFGDYVRKSVVNCLPNISDTYDISIAYSDNSPMYYVAKKVNAKEKYLWIHANYSKVNRKIIDLKIIYLQFSKVICVSEEIQRSFLNIFPDFSKKTLVINNILNTNMIDKRKNEKICEFSNNKINLLSVGRLSVEKNYITLIKAYDLLSKQEKECTKLFIIGQGNLFLKLKKYIKQKRLTDNVMLLGVKKNPYSYISKCTIYLQPSNFEGYCTTINEAKYLCKPIICTFEAGNNLIADKKNGLLVENNPNDISKMISWLIKNIEFQQELINNLEQELNNENINIKKFDKLIE